MPVSVFFITTVLSQTHLSEGTALDYFKELIWDDTLQQDRFFAYAHNKVNGADSASCLAGVVCSRTRAEFSHRGATVYYKQLQFGEANAHISFHENDTRKIDKIECVKVEPDID